MGIMEISKTDIEGLLIIKPKVFEDDRGYFFESWNKEAFETHGIKYKFLQDNQSLSHSGVLRGLHLQNPPYEQGKLVRVVHGEVYDVAVDLRHDSPTFGQWEAVILTEENKTQFWVPPGFAHGFLVLSDTADFEYKCTDYYDPSDEVSILWNDPDLNISWPITSPILSDKDAGGVRLIDLKR